MVDALIIRNEGGASNHKLFEILMFVVIFITMDH